MSNVFEIDATEIGADGLVVPKDVDGEPAAYELGRSVKSDFAIKVVNGADEAVDVTPLVSTSDDSAFDEFAEDGDLETVDADAVALHSSDTVAGYIGAELTADPVPTSGTVKVVFNSRLYGGA